MLALALMGVVAVIVGEVFLGWGEVATITVRSEPPGALIELDGVTMPVRTPAQLRAVRVAREHRVRLTREGFRPFETVIRAGSRSAAQKNISVQLTPVPVGQPGPSQKSTDAAPP